MTPPMESQSAYLKHLTPYRVFHLGLLRNSFTPTFKFKSNDL